MLGIVKVGNPSSIALWSTGSAFVLPTCVGLFVDHPRKDPRPPSLVSCSQLFHDFGILVEDVPVFAGIVLEVVEFGVINQTKPFILNRVSVIFRLGRCSQAPT